MLDIGTRSSTFRCKVNKDAMQAATLTLRARRASNASPEISSASRCNTGRQCRSMTPAIAREWRRLPRRARADPRWQVMDTSANLLPIEIFC